MDRVVVGSQAFGLCSAFNVNIGAWNVASMTTLGNVFAAFGRGERRGGGGLDALPL